jgi:chromosome segregation ATPase
MGRYSDSLTDTIVSAVIEDSNFEDAVKNILSEEIEDVVEAAVENEDIQDKIDTTVNDITKHLNDDIEHLRDNHYKFVDKTDKFYERFQERIENLESAYNGIVEENETLTSRLENISDAHNRLASEVERLTFDYARLKSDMMDIEEKTGKTIRGIFNMIYEMKNQLRKIPIVKRLFM